MPQKSVLLVVLFYAINLAASEDITVTLDGLGTLLGSREDFIYPYYPQRNQTVDVFRGVPYAEPPTGNLRLAKTESKQPWTNTYNATYFRSQCWGWRNTSFEFTDSQSEDCLYLNIWSPNIRNSNYPVMIWIHGGSFQWGSGTTIVYMGDALASYNEVIVVTINYRLNGFGFMSTADYDIPGNFALWDQAEAIRWVKEHISKFGGDPTRITLFGQSAGGASVAYHMVSPKSMDNINNGIIMSGSVSVSTSFESVRNSAFDLGSRVGCSNIINSYQLLSCLRTVPELELANEMVQTAFGPILDYDFFPDTPDKIMERKKFKQSPLMIGTTKDDGSFAAMFLFVDQGFTDDPQCNRARFRRNVERFAGGNDLIADAIEQTYIDWAHAEEEDANYFYDFIAMATDASICGQSNVARAWAGADLPVYRYVFSYEPINTIYPETPNWKPLPPWKGVAHGDEMQFVFGNAFQFYERNGVYDDDEVSLSLDMMRYYSNFAKTGDPNTGGDNDDIGDDEPIWSQFKLPDRIFQMQKPEMEDFPGYRSEQCALWRHLVPKLHTFSGDINSVWEDWQGDYSRWLNEDMIHWQNEWQQETSTPCT